MYTREAIQKCIQSFSRKTWRTETFREAKDNIKMDLKEMGCDAQNRIELAQDRDKLCVYK